MKEEWKPIKGYEGIYEVSNLGSVRCCGYSIVATSCKGNKFVTEIKPHILHATNNGCGYWQVSLQKDHKRKNHYVHRLVAEAFLGDIPEKHQVNHIDYNKSNNNVDNLEIISPSLNTKHSIWKTVRPKKSNPASGYKHIRLRKNRYSVEIDYKGTSYYFGSYPTVEQAIATREQAYAKIQYYR